MKGPSFTRSTSICAPNTPRPTRMPRVSNALANDSTRSAATAGSAAAVHDGRRPFRVSAYSVNCETTSASPSTSATGKDRITRLRFTFELGDIAHLSSVLAAVKRVESVFDAYRVVPS